MAFIVEDGTGLPDATSYGSLEEARSYWEDHDFDHSKFPPNAKLERALIRGTQHIETYFGHLFLYCRLVPEVQRLSFPRVDFYLYGKLITGVVPEGIKYACFEYAQRILVSGDLVPDPGGFDATGASIRRKETKVGPIETSTSYEQGTENQLRNYPQADILLRPFTIAVAGVVRN